MYFPCTFLKKVLEDVLYQKMVAAGQGIKKEEDEIQYIKEEKRIPRMVKDEIISESNWFRTSLKK